MQSIQDLQAPSLPHAWAETHTELHDAGLLEPQASRLAFADPEFLLRRETRGIRFQLEMLKPDLAQTEAKIEHTVVVWQCPLPRHGHGAGQTAGSGTER